MWFENGEGKSSGVKPLTLNTQVPVLKISATGIVNVLSEGFLFTAHRPDECHPKVLFTSYNFLMGKMFLKLRNCDRLASVTTFIQSLLNLELELIRNSK